jgi:hypothetical protein
MLPVEDLENLGPKRAVMLHAILRIYQWVFGFILLALCFFSSIWFSLFVKFGIHYFVPKSSVGVFKTRMRRNLRALRFLSFFTLLYFSIPWLDLPNNIAIFIYNIEQILITLVVA